MQEAGIWYSTWAATWLSLSKVGVIGFEFQLHSRCYLLIQIPLFGSNRWRLSCLSSCPVCGRFVLSSRFLAFAYLFLDTNGHLGNEPKNGWSLFVSLCLCFTSSEMNFKTKNFKDTQYVWWYFPRHCGVESKLSARESVSTFSKVPNFYFHSLLITWP